VLFCQLAVLARGPSGVTCAVYTGLNCRCILDTERQAGTERWEGMGWQLPHRDEPTQAGPDSAWPQSRHPLVPRPLRRPIPHQHLARIACNVTITWARTDLSPFLAGLRGRQPQHRLVETAQLHSWLQVEGRRGADIHPSRSHR
jgi:hypothetical protein